MRKIFIIYLFFFLLGILTVLAGSYFYSEVYKPNPNTDQANIVTVSDEPKPNQKTSGFGLLISNDYTIDLFAQDLGKPKVMQADKGGNLYVTVADQGKVIAFRDTDRNGKHDLSITLIKGLVQPNGMQVICLDEKTCDMYIAESDKVSLYKVDSEKLEAVFTKKLFDLPNDGLNELRSLKIVTIDNKQVLMVGIGSSCNVCEEKSEKRATVLIADLSGENVKVYATGLRNPTSIVQNQANKEIYVTDVGRDWLGDNLPDDEINIVVQGGFYGWPYCYNDSEMDTSFKSDQKAADMCTLAVKPQIKLPAHSGPTGIAIGHLPKYGADNKLYEPDRIFIALHGSWNRSIPSGYKIIYFEMDKSGNITSEPKDFVTGFIQNDEIKYRPTDIFINGFEMYVTDDHTGKIFVIRKNG